MACLIFMLINKAVTDRPEAYPRHFGPLLLSLFTRDDRSAYSTSNFNSRSFSEF